MLRISERCVFREKKSNIIQWNPVNTDTKGTSQIVRINGVSVLSGFSEKVTDTCFIDAKTAKKRCLIVL